MKSDIEIEDELYRIVKQSQLSTEIDGDIYKGPYERPDGSDSEDIEIIVIANQNAEIQLCTVNVNIYVKDILIDGQYRKNNQRLRELSSMSKEILETINQDGYRINLDSQRVLKEGQVNQHMICNKLNYKFYNP